MNICLNSKIARLILFPNMHTIMLFGFILSKKSKLTRKEIRHEMCHVLQYDDCMIIGSFISMLAILIFFGFQVISLHLLWLLLFPVILYYIIYLLEFGVRFIQYRNWTDAYRNIGFERQARWYSMNCTKYQSFDWWSDFNNKTK